MESNCFICGIGKDYFDKVPHGFDTHVMQEHNLGMSLFCLILSLQLSFKSIFFMFSANYMFFLMHLINKPDTEYTGQETYVNFKLLKFAQKLQVCFYSGVEYVSTTMLGLFPCW